MLVHIQDNRLGDFTYDDTEYELKNIQRKKTLIFKDKNTSRTDIVIPAGIKVCDFMFKECRYLEQAPKIPTSVISCNSMFFKCMHLKKINRLPNQIRYAQHMFGYCQLLETVTNIPTDIRDCSWMFSSCISLKKVPLFSVDHKHFETSEYMFYECNKLKTFNYKSFEHSINTTTNMYKECHSLVRNFALPKTSKEFNFMTKHLQNMHASFSSKSKDSVDIMPLCNIVDYGFQDSVSLEQFFKHKVLKIHYNTIMEIDSNNGVY